MKWHIKIPNISPVLRITIGLILLTLSLLLVGDLLGVTPNQQASEVHSRKVMAESLAIQISSEIGSKRINEAAKLLNIIVKRNDMIQSIALKTNVNKIIMESDNHHMYWKGREDGQSTPNYIQVPIHGKQGRWGTLEVSFVPIGTIWSNMFTLHSFSAMLLYIFVFGFLGYWLFLRRALSELDPSAVIPERVRSALDVLNEGLVIIDINERIVLINNALKKKLALPESKLMGKRLSSLPWKNIEDNTLLDKNMLPWNIVLDTGKEAVLKTIKLITAHKETLTLDVNVAPIKAPNQKIKGVIITIDDMTELEKKNSELTYILEKLELSKEEISRQNLELTELATRDPLTRLLNRRALFSSLSILFLEAKERYETLSCMMLDIDFFKSVNDTYGHLTGDKVIQVFADILRTESENDTLICRYGGEEFVIILTHTSIEYTIEIAEKIRASIASYDFTDIAVGLKVTTSIGISFTEFSHEETMDKLIEKADKSLYEAKQSGRNKVVQYRNDIDEEDISENTKRTSSSSNIVTKVNKTISRTRNSDNLSACENSIHTIVIDRLRQAQNMVQRNRKNLAVLSIFIDTIQVTNNTLGHSVANKLKKVAYERLSKSFRKSDSMIPSVEINNYTSLSRLSDSEFIAILSGIDKSDDITWAIFRMMKSLAEPANIHGHELVMIANVGVSIYPLDNESPEVLLANSKIALDKAREKGRGEFVFYNKEMNMIAKKALIMESQLHLALEREELYLNFQPIVDMKNGKVQKVETLLRWKNAELGVVIPDIFVDIAEHSGSIKEIGLWVIEQSCRQLYIWQTQGYPELSISINLSAVQFYQKDLVEDIFQITKQENVLPHSIVFELTETALLKKEDHIIENIYALHKLGFKIALDDFGTGYSSLAYLQKFPIDIIKIDRTLMFDFPHNLHTVSIVSGLIGLCHNIGIEVICEGVEKENQLAVLVKILCDEVQGFLICEPCDVDEMTLFLGSNKSRKMLRRAQKENKIVDTTQEKILIEEILNAPPS